MQKLSRKYFLNLLIILLAGVVNTRCALLGNNDEDIGAKNFQVKYSAPEIPWEKVPVSTADIVWQSKNIGSTIAINSLCKKYQDITLENLKKNILSGIEELRIEKSSKITFEGRDAERI